MQDPTAVRCVRGEGQVGYRNGAARRPKQDELLSEQRDSSCSPSRFPVNGKLAQGSSLVYFQKTSRAAVGGARGSSFSSGPGQPGSPRLRRPLRTPRQLTRSGRGHQPRSTRFIYTRFRDTHAGQPASCALLISAGLRGSGRPRAAAQAAAPCARCRAARPARRPARAGGSRRAGQRGFLRP